MRIDAVELRHVRMRLRSPFTTSFGVELDRDCLILSVEAEGIVGWGECVAGRRPGYSYETVGTAWHALVDFFIPAALGCELAGIEGFREAIAGYKGHPLARAGLELALWDWTGKATGRSLRDLIGGAGESVRVGVSVGIQDSPEALVETVAGYLAEGYRRVKVKIMPGRDLLDVMAVRDAFPEVPLQVDANSAYRLDQISVFLAMDDLGLLLIEQPLAEDDLIDHSRLQARLKTPVCLDESILSARHARQAIEVGACRVINIKQGRVGGLSEALAVHDLCFERGVPVWCGGMLETGIGRAANLALASLPGFTLPGDISASDRYYDQDIAEPRFELNPDGTIDVPRGIGLGIEINWEALEGYTLRRQRFAA